MIHTAQRLLADTNNGLRVATPTASSIRAALRQVYPQATARSGTGLVALTGGYTGDQDATFDVQIRTGAGNPQCTDPVLVGAGSGTLVSASATAGTADQTLTVTLVDLGTTTTAAQAILYGDILLRARSTGTGGNSISLGITPNLALSTSPIGALAEELARETQEWSDQRLDFGALPLNPDGTLSASCPRLVFGRDTSRVYRHYKRWDGDQWQYGVSPKLAATYGVGAQVHTVTGNYTVVVTDGVTTESVSGATLYDVLLALSASALIEVVGIIANDQRPGGQAAIDLPIRTSAFALPVVKAREDMPDLVGLTVAATAPTEVLTLECVDDSAINAESWAVKSKVAGALPRATTGVAYDGPYVDFAIPKGTISERPIDGSIAISATDLEGKGNPKAYPSICFYRPTLGAAATNKTLTLVWTARPAEDCPCDSVTVTGRPNEEYLGVDLGDDDAMTTLTAGHQSRLEALTSWHKTFVAGNTEVTTRGELRAADLDLQLAQLAVDELADCLTDLYGADAVLTAPARANATAYALYAVVEPATRNNYRYRCTVAGTSASSPPTWPTTVGTTVVDGTVTWTCASKIPEIAWDDVLSGLNTDLTSLATLGAEVVPSISTLFSDSSSKYANTISAAPVEGTSYTGVASDGTVHTYKAVSVYVVGTPPNGYGTAPTHTSLDLRTLESFDSSSPPTWGYRITWQDLGQVDTTADMNSIGNQEFDLGILRDPQTWSQRYLAACNYVRTLAGLLPKADAGLIPTAGSGVWSDPGDAYYWVIQGTQYLPVFNNRYYHSCKSVISQDCGGTSIEPTYEFGFALQIGCPERLVAGDTVTIVIGDIAVQRPYQVGDSYEIPLVMGGPLVFSGGVTGTDTLTWTVYSSTQGALDPYLLTLLEPAYNDGGIGFTIHRGAIDFDLGDQFSFAVEVGHYFRWRKNSGSWSADVALATTVLSDGLSAAFTGGPAPSFVTDDLYTFNVLQPYSPYHPLEASDEGWQWSGDSATLTLTLTGDIEVEVVGILRHTLTTGATASIALKNAAGTTLRTETLTVKAGPLVAVLPAKLTTVRSVVVTVATAASMSLGWVYAGCPWASTYPAVSINLSRRYALERGGGINPRGRYLAAGRGGEIRWETFFTAADWTALLAILDSCKEHGDRPIVLLPNTSAAADAVLARISTDDLVLNDYYQFQNGANRYMDVTLPLEAILG